MLNLVALNPLFLWLLPLAGLPVIFHLFFRVRKRLQPFSSLMFLRVADPHLSARRKLREWLALLLRALAILLLLLALARPIWLGTGSAGSVAAVLVLDNSGSMSGLAPDSRPKLNHALEAAGAVVSDLGARDQAGLVLLVDDVAAALPPGLESDKKKLLSALDRISGTEAAGTPGRALARAATLLRAGSAARREIHVFSDLQRHEWDAALAAPLDLPPGVALTVHQVPTARAQAPDVAVTGVDLPARRLLAGRHAEAAVQLFNPTASAASVRLNARDAQSALTTREVTVPGRAAKAVAVPFKPAAPGFYWLHAWVEGDAFAADNHAWVAATVHDKADVLFLGPREAFGLTPTAISPSRDGLLSGLVPTFGEPAAASKLAAPRPVMVAALWEDLPGMARSGAAAALQSYVEQGGVLLVLPRAESPAAAIEAAPWLGATPGAEGGKKEGEPVVILDKSSRLWDELRDERGEVLLRQVKAFRYRPLAAAAGSEALLGLEDGRVLLCRRGLGRGAVFASGLATDARWSNLPLKGGFLAVMQSVALWNPAATQDVLTVEAGEPVAAFAGLKEKANAKSLAGDPLEWAGPAGEMPAFARTGVYEVKIAEETRRVAVRCSDQEGASPFIQDSRVPALGRLAYTVLPYTDTGTMLARLRRSRTGIDLFAPLLGLACLAVVLEGWVVNPRPRARS